MASALPANKGDLLDSSNEIKVLYVDDNAALLELAKFFLKHVDKRLVIVTATSATAALQLLAKETFDVIVSDYCMPEMNGLEFLEQLRSKGNTVPFVLCTGSEKEEVVIQFLHLGVRCYIKKNGVPASLFGILAWAISREVEH